jgi:uncharacterized protein
VIVDCDHRKWPDRPHWRFPAHILDRDEHGTWLVTEPPTPFTGPKTGVWTHRFVTLVPEDEWWLASFYDTLTDSELAFEIYVDISTPARWLTPQHVQSVDLDLDVIHFPDGRTLIDDEDEFIEHQKLYGYPDDIITRARDTADRMLELVASRAEPFGRAGLDRARYVRP